MPSFSFCKNCQEPANEYYEKKSEQCTEKNKIITDAINTTYTLSEYYPFLFPVIFFHTI